MNDVTLDDQEDYPMMKISNVTIQSESTDPWRIPRPIYIAGIRVGEIAYKARWIELSLPVELIEQMETLANAREVTRSVVAIEALELGLPKLIEAHRKAMEE